MWKLSRSYLTEKLKRSLNIHSWDTQTAYHNPLKPPFFSWSFCIKYCIKCIYVKKNCRTERAYYISHKNRKMLTYSYPWKQFSFRCMYCAGLWILQHCNLLLFGSKKVNFTNKTISCRIWITSFKLNEFNEIVVSTYFYSIIGGLHLPRYFS